MIHRLIIGLVNTMKSARRVKSLLAHVAAAAPRDFPEHGCAMVFGGSGGLGAEICVALAEAGVNNIALSYYSNEEAANTVASAVRAVGSASMVGKVVAEDIDSVQEFVNLAHNAFGSIHTVVNASGPSLSLIPLLRVPSEQFSSVIDQDLKGAFNIVQCVVPKLIDNGGGSLVAVTTSATDGPVVPGDALSSIPKAAVNMLVRHVAKEYGSKGVRANIVGPGIIETAGLGERMLAESVAAGK